MVYLPWENPEDVTKVIWVIGNHIAVHWVSNPSTAVIFKKGNARYSLRFIKFVIVSYGWSGLVIL